MRWCLARRRKPGGAALILALLACATLYGWVTWRPSSSDDDVMRLPTTTAFLASAPPTPAPAPPTPAPAPARLPSTAIQIANDRLAAAASNETVIRNGQITVVNDSLVGSAFVHPSRQRVVVVGLAPKLWFVSAVECAVSPDAGVTWIAAQSSFANNLHDYLEHSVVVCVCQFPREGALLRAGASLHVRLVWQKDCIHIKERLALQQAQLAVPPMPAESPCDPIRETLHWINVLAPPHPPTARLLSVCVPSFYGHVLAEPVLAWVNYHRKLGVDRFFLYDMGSDMPRELFSSLVSRGVVSFHPLQLPPVWHQHRDFRQINNAFWRADCLARSRQAGTRTLFADADEFMQLLDAGPGLDANDQRPPLQAFLDRYPAAWSVSFGTIVVLTKVCVPPLADSRRPAEPLGASLWGPDQAWARRMVYRSAQPTCPVRVRNPTTCPGFMGHRKFVIMHDENVHVVLQHETLETKLAEVVPTTLAYMAHYRGLVAPGSIRHCNITNLTSVPNQDTAWNNSWIRGLVRDEALGHRVASVLSQI